MKLNKIITKSICFFCFLPAILKPVHLFAQSELQEIDSEINITLDGKKLSIHISLNEPFRWKNTRYESLKKFPQPWIGLPDIPNEIWFKSRADMEMRITDMMFIGEYEVLEKFKVASTLFGVGEVIGVFNAKSNLLKFDNLDYAPFYPTSRIVLEESIDMKKWNKVNLSNDLPKEYRWPEEIKIDLQISGVKQKFFRVKIQDR